MIATEDIARPKADPNDPGQVGAPMSGVVVELRIHVGSHVKKGDPIAVLSAMKMEMVISAPHAGKIDQIKVAEGVPVPLVLSGLIYRNRTRLIHRI